MERETGDLTRKCSEQEIQISKLQTEKTHAADQVDSLKKQSSEVQDELMQKNLAFDRDQALSGQQVSGLFLINARPNS